MVRGALHQWALWHQVPLSQIDRLHLLILTHLWPFVDKEAVLLEGSEAYGDPVTLSTFHVEGFRCPHRAQYHGYSRPLTYP